MNKRKSGIISMGTFWWVLIIVAVAIMSAVFLYPKIKDKNRRLAELKKRQAILEQKEAERNKYMKQIDDLNNDKDTVEKTAKEKYNLHRPGERVVHLKNK